MSNGPTNANVKQSQSVQQAIQSAQQHMDRNRARPKQAARALQLAESRLVYHLAFNGWLANDYGYKAVELSQRINEVWTRVRAAHPSTVHVG